MEEAVKALALGLLGRGAALKVGVEFDAGAGVELVEAGEVELGQAAVQENDLEVEVTGACGRAGELGAPALGQA